MMRRRRDEGFSLIELMMVIAVIGILVTVLIPQFGDVKSAAKITGVENNVRSVVITISGMSSTEDIDDSLGTTMSSMKNPITNETGVGTSAPSNRTQTKAVYVFYDSSTTWTNNSLYNGAVVVYAHSDFSADVFAIDEQGHSISDLHSKVDR
ncbi:MAG: hypothetical protein H6Q63_1076 [Firmicutes bacterium]|nr:hypothetical protein [Bacillota bacterium]